MLARYKLERDSEQAKSDKNCKKKKAKNKKLTDSIAANSLDSEGSKGKTETSVRKKKLKEKWQESSSSSSDSKKLTGESEVESLPQEDGAETEARTETVSLNLSDRPIRAAAATAQAISEVQQEFLSLEPPPEFKRNRRGEIEVLVDKPTKPRKYARRAKLVHTPSTESEKDVDEEEISKYVSEMMERFKTQFLSMLSTMQDPIFRRNVEIQIIREQRRHEELARRVGQLESQVKVLVQESLEMLKFVLKLLGIEASNPSEFIEKAKEIVCNHNELQNKRLAIETEVLQLQEEQSLILKEKEKQLMEGVLPHRASLHLSEEETLRLVQSELAACVSSQVVDVTLTRVHTDNDNNNNNCQDLRKFHTSKFGLEDTKNETKDNIELQNGSESVGEKTEIGASVGLSNSAVLSHINREIERNMRRTDVFPSFPQAISSTVSARLEKVIEDSVRGSSPSPANTPGQDGTAATGNNEGLASRLETCDVTKDATIKESDGKCVLLKRKRSPSPERVDERVRWQEEISTGFDRLVALASEADLRRRSVDTNSDLSQSNVVTVSSSPSSTEASQLPPGEKLPERHFKKRYFDQERLQQQKIKKT